MNAQQKLDALEEMLKAQYVKSESLPDFSRDVEAGWPVSMYELMSETLDKVEDILAS